MGSAALLTTAKQHHRAGELQRARQIYRQILADEPDNPDVLHLLGVAALQSGEHLQAVSLITRALEQRSDFATAHNNLGAALRDLGRVAEARAAFERALAIDPGFADACFNYACLLHAAGEVQAAISHYRRAIALEPDFGDAYLNLGNALKAAGDREAAITTYQEALRRTQTAQAHFNLGLTLLEAGRAADAVDALRSCIERDPTLAQAHYCLGNALRAMGDTRGAEAAYVHATQAGPGLVGAQAALADLWFELGDSRAVLAQYNAAEGLIAQGKPRAALDLLGANLRLIDHKTRTLAAKAAAHLQAGDHDAARALLDYDRFVVSYPLDSPPGYDGIGHFNRVLTSYLTERSTFSTAPKQAPELRYQQSDELLVEATGPLAALRDGIHAAVQRYRREVADNPEHVFPLDRPARYRLQGWAVVMHGQGYKDPHCHPPGWASGVYYVEVPDVTSANDGAHAGWLEIGRPDPRLYPLAEEPEVALHQPRAGWLVLFPSYFYHRTLPFRSSQRRISFAFDVLPEQAGPGAPS